MGSIYHKIDRRGRKVYYIDYRVRGVRRRERVGSSKRAAQEALESRLTDVRRHKFDRIFPETVYTLSEIRDQYLKSSKTTKSIRTCERDRGIVDRLLIPFFGENSLNQITPEQVEDYRNRRAAGGIAPATINKEVQVLKHIVKKAGEWGKIRTNQIADVKPLKTPPGRVRYLQPEQIPKLVKACPPWLRPIVLIDMNTGLRRGEILGLQKGNIDGKNRLIIIEKTKNNERKALPMNQIVYEVISSLPTRMDTTFIFADEHGKPLSPDKVSMAFKRSCRQAGIEDFSLHDLRHHFASYLTMSGQNQRTVQELLGHKDPKMTMRYSHLSPEHLRSAVESLETFTETTRKTHSP